MHRVYTAPCNTETIELNEVLKGKIFELYLLGHLALGYFFSKALQRRLRYDYNLLVLGAFSLLPDIDFYLQNVKHRGPTHSLAAILLLLILTLAYTKLAPYLIAYGSHIFGDVITSQGTQLLWPIEDRFYRVQVPFLYGETQLLVEFVLFLLAIILIIYFKDYNNII